MKKLKEENAMLSADSFMVIKEIESLAVELLTSLIVKHDYIPVIVTNATPGWVEYSSNLYMPKLLHFINMNNIKIVSAHSYSDLYPNDYAQWKISAFSDLLDELLFDPPRWMEIKDVTFEQLDMDIDRDNSHDALAEIESRSRNKTYTKSHLDALTEIGFSKDEIIDGKPKQSKQSPQSPQPATEVTTKVLLECKHTYEYADVISIGDSEYELAATRAIRNAIKSFPARTKFVKFVDTPNIHMVKAQLKFINDSMASIIEMPTDIDLALSIPVEI